MKKFFTVLGVLFLIALIVTILAGKTTWKDAKNKGATVKESFIKVSKNVGETAVKINDSIQKKIKDGREYWNKKREEK
jgi:hypothetical protein